MMVKFECCVSSLLIISSTGGVLIVLLAWVRNTLEHYRGNYL
jgi:hypothetical protein